MPEPMSDARLAEIDRQHGSGLCWDADEPGACHEYVGELLADNRRLRCALRLSEGSRGVPAAMADRTAVRLRGRCGWCSAESVAPDPIRHTPTCSMPDDWQGLIPDTPIAWTIEAPGLRDTVGRD